MSVLFRSQEESSGFKNKVRNKFVIGVSLVPVSRRKFVISVSRVPELGA